MPESKEELLAREAQLLKEVISIEQQLGSGPLPQHPSKDQPNDVFATLRKMTLPVSRPASFYVGNMSSSPDAGTGSNKPDPIQFFFGGTKMWLW